MRHIMDTQSFADFLDKQPAGLRYNYLNNETCAICQYLKHVGLKFTRVTNTTWIDTNNQHHELPKGWNEISRGARGCGAVNCSVWTFGAAAERARLFISDRKKFDRENPHINSILAEAFADAFRYGVPVQRELCDA